VKNVASRTTENELQQKTTDSELGATGKEKRAEPKCPFCKSSNVYGVSRVVGYYSIIENWNRSKKAELLQRQQGNYWPKAPEKRETKNES